MAASGAPKSPEKSPCGWPSPGFVPVEQMAGGVEALGGNVCRLAAVALKDETGLRQLRGFDADYAPLIIEVVENVKMSYSRGPRRS